jgi:hypothetical protein
MWTPLQSLLVSFLDDHDDTENCAETLTLALKVNTSVTNLK